MISSAKNFGFSSSMINQTKLVQFGTGKVQKRHQLRDDIYSYGGN